MVNVSLKTFFFAHQNFRKFRRRQIFSDVRGEAPARAAGAVAEGVNR